MQSKLILTPWCASYLNQTNAIFSTVVLKCMFGWAEVLLCKKERVRVKLLRSLLVCVKRKNFHAGCLKRIHVFLTLRFCSFILCFCVHSVPFASIQKLLIDDSRTKSHVIKVIEGFETVMFKSKFVELATHA